MTSSTDYKFMGWLGLDRDADNGKMVWQEYEPKAWEETDVDIQITHSDICGSDLHVLRSGWVSLMIEKQSPEAYADSICRGRRLTHVVSVTKSLGELYA